MLLIYTVAVTAFIVSFQIGCLSAIAFHSSTKRISKTQLSTTNLSISGYGQTQPSDRQLEQWMEEAAKIYNINPNFLKALAHIETRKGQRRYRCGWIGKPTKRFPGTYCGPMAIHHYKFGQGVAIDDPKTNIYVGAKAMAGVGDDPVAQKKRLKGDGKRKGYNASFTESYWREIKKAETMFARETGK
jgi:hypothetical protein